MAESIGIAPPGYRLPDATRIGRIRLQVGDIDRSIAYYQRVLGLEVRERSESFASLGPIGGGDTILELKERKDARAVPRRGLLGLYHFAVLLPDRASLGRFVEHLAEIGAYAGMSDHLVSEAVYLTDPDGLGIEVYADRPRSSWRETGGTLAMATDPLDLDGLARAAGGERWSGAPHGTRMGHVHLFVADLDLSARFYHEGLGLDRVVLDFPGALFMSAGGYHHHLGTNTWAAGAPRATEGDARLLEWTVRLPSHADVEDVARSLTAGGHGVVRDGAALVATDPWGTAVRVTAMS